MKPVILLAVLACTAFPAFADGKGNKHNDHPGYSSRTCPPGLAKKSPACVPPGLAKHHAYRVGDRLPSGYEWLREPRRYGLPDGTYAVLDGQVFRVNRNTVEVIAAYGLLSSLLN